MGDVWFDRLCDDSFVCGVRGLLQSYWAGRLIVWIAFHFPLLFRSPLRVASANALWEGDCGVRRFWR